MAGLTSPPTQRWTSAQSRAQFAALAQLRWCLFRNGFRRKGGTGELAARILLIPFLGILAAGPVLGAGIAGYYIVSSAQFSKLPALTWSIFALWQLVSINISAPQLSFDIASILRFPISFPRYLTARLVFGLLSAANVIGTLALLSADVGIGIARPSLLSWATLLLALFAAANIFFTRMIFAWIDRWLSTRRARELLTAFILFASLGFEYLNVTFNPGMQSGRHHHASHLPALLKILHRIEPIAALLPPGLTASSILGFAQSRYLPVDLRLAHAP
jgi:ABC-2 type transport system permease protein